MTELTGGCQCGAVRWHHSGTFIRHLICHCESCRRATSSAFAAFVGTRSENVTWSGEINHLETSPGARRGFCPTCGTRLYFRSDRWPGELHIHLGALDDPSPYRPDAHVVLAEKIDWVTLADTVAKRDGFSMAPAAKLSVGDNG